MYQRLTSNLDHFKEFASIPESQINQRIKISQPIADQLNEAYEDARRGPRYYLDTIGIDIFGKSVPIRNLKNGTNVI